MPEEEASYYEIALTSRQVLVSFIVALACVALAFFAGLWVGQQAESEPVTAEVTAEDGENDGTMPTLDFFDEPDSEAQAAPARQERQVAERASQPSVQRPTTSGSSSTGSIGNAPEPGSIVLQVFASTDRSAAEDVVRRLSDAGYNPYLKSFTSGDRRFHRVRVGPFPNRDLAEDAKKRIESSLKLEPFITTSE